MMTDKPKRESNEAKKMKDSGIKGTNTVEDRIKD
jgi:hypothetical protein